MTKKDYILLADVLAALDVKIALRSKVASAIAVALASDNPRFDRVRFMARATGIPRTADQS